MKIEQFNSKTQAQIRKMLADSPAVCSSKSKPNRHKALDKKAGVPELYPPCYFRVICCKRGCNWDADNIETKAVLDGLVQAGIIPDDTIKEIPKVYREGIQVKTKEEERTVIEVIEL